ncbi:MAG TPA: hypothetical protein DCX54_03735 [Flavobacteriales bacterium]|nr:hypothetical protein [Flavobacteriales bacterium]
MKTVKTTLLLGLFLLLSAAIQSQTTFKIDSINIDSGTVSPTYCVNKYQTNFYIPISLSGYTQGDSVEVIINYGDGITDIKNFAIYGSGTNFCYVYFSHKYTTVGNYKVFVMAVAPDLKTDTYLSKNSVNVVTCGTISGNVFFDGNNNCVKDVSEPDLRFAWIKVKDKSSPPNVYYGHADIQGNYSVDVPTSKMYDISIHSAYYPNFCPVGGYSNVWAPANSKNFGMSCNSSIFDLTGGVSGILRPGFNRSISVRPYNLSCMPKSGRIRIILSDPRISYSYTPSNHLPPVVSGDTLSWNFSNVSFYSNQHWSNFHVVYVMTDSSATVGDTICIDMIVEPIAGDNNPANNLKTFCLPVRNSIDPNDKTGLPVGLGPDKIIARGQSLDYTIRFQNTGNDTAYKVVIHDSLPKELDIESLVINGATHPFNFYLIDGRVLKFEFLDINLPDSTTNEELSHGSINFTIGQLPNLPFGTVVENTAHIFFDFNEAITTNTEHHRIDLIGGIVHHEQIGSLSVNIYPNPGSDKIWLDIASGKPVTVTMFNVLGKTVSRSNFAHGKHSVDVSTLQNGVYFVEVKSGDQRITQKLIIRK